MRDFDMGSDFVIEAKSRPVKEIQPFG